MNTEPEESFPGFKEPPPPHRETGPDELRRWTVFEDLVVWATLMPRGSREDYRTACEWLCKTLDRLPTAGDMEQKYVTQIEHRTVTINMEYENAELLRWAGILYGGCRSGLPLSWAEQYGVVEKYHRKGLNGRDRVPLETVCVLMGRDPDDDLVRDYLHVVDMGRVDRREYPNPMPNDHEIARLARRAAKDPIPLVWVEYVSTCQGA